MKLSRTELKILVYNKTKRGISYEQAVREVRDELNTMNDINNLERAKSKQKKIWTKENLQQ